MTGDGFKELTTKGLFALVAALAACGALGQPPPVVLQEGPEASGPSIFQFSFSNPGARSMGLGGAFAALADDATAAFANPAGLVQLLEPEVAVEGRSWSFSTPYTAGGRVSGEPTGLGVDVTPGIVEARSSDRTRGLSFLSFVYPKKRWAVALYRHQLANFEAGTATQGLFADAPDGSVIRFWDLRRSTDLEITGYGVAGAVRVNEALSLGAGVVYHDGTMLSTGTVYLTDDDSVAGSYGENSYLPERLIGTVPWSIDSTDWVVHGGFLWRLSELWHVGGFYRQGPRFDLVAKIEAGPAAADVFGMPAGTVLRQARTPISFPDVFGVGVSYRSRGGAWTVGFEWDRVEYSDIVNSVDPEAFDDPAVLEDGDELHLGSEYVFRDSTPIVAVRLGVWLDPDHELSFPGDDPASRAIFRGGEDELHLAVGFGFAFESFQIDLGMDFSDPVDTVSASVVYSF